MAGFRNVFKNDVTVDKAGRQAYLLCGYQCYNNSCKLCNNNVSTRIEAEPMKLEFP